MYLCLVTPVADIYYKVPNIDESTHLRQKNHDNAILLAAFLI